MKKGISIFVLFAIITAGSVFSQVPQGDLWKNKILYVGASAGLGPIFGADGNVLGGNISPIQLEWQITRFFALGTGLNLYFGPKTQFTALKQSDPASGLTETYGGMETHIIFPLLLEFTYRPSIFSLEIGGGAYAAPIAMNTTVERTNENGYTISEGYGKKLFTAERDNPFGFLVKAGFGVKVGEGILFINGNYLRDFSEIIVKFHDEKAGNHLWNMLSINIGYKYGFFNRAGK